MIRFLMVVVPAGLLLAGMGTPPAEAPRAPLVSLDWLRPVSLEVAETDSGAVVTFTTANPATLQAIRDYVAELAAAAAPTATDPVCGMTVDRALAEEDELTATHGGRTYFFCSGSCRSDFLRQPARYAYP
jgi:YHS domain-containing protein